MKKLIPIFMLLLIGFFEFGLIVSDARMSLPMLFGTSGIVCDDCSGSLKFAWHMEDNDATPDVTIGNPCGCSDGATVGTEYGTPAFSSVQKSDGSYSLLINGLEEGYYFTVSSEDLIAIDDCKVTFDIYVSSSPASEDSCFIVASDEVDDFIYMCLNADNTITSYYSGNGTSDDITVSVATGQWVSCEYQAKTGVIGNDHYFACGISSTEEDDDLVAYNTGIVQLTIGETGGSFAATYYLDNLKIYPSDRY